MLRLTSILSSLLLIIFFLSFSGKNKQRKLWVIFFYVVISFFSDLTLLVFDNQFDPFYLFLCFTIVECSLFSLFYYLTYTTKTFIRILIFCYALFMSLAIYTLVQPPSTTFDSLTTTLEAVFIIFFSILFFYEQLNDPEITFIYDTKDFWIVVAFLLYLSGTLFLYISTDLMSYRQRYNFWDINQYANIIKNVLLGLAFSKPIFKKINNDRSII